VLLVLDSCLDVMFAAVSEKKAQRSFESCVLLVMFRFLLVIAC
jgi:hypothetical protein